MRQLLISATFALVLCGCDRHPSGNAAVHPSNRMVPCADLPEDLLRTQPGCVPKDAPPKLENPSTVYRVWDRYEAMDPSHGISTLLDLDTSTLVVDHNLRRIDAERKVSTSILNDGKWVAWTYWADCKLHSVYSSSLEMKHNDGTNNFPWQIPEPRTEDEAVLRFLCSF